MALGDEGFLVVSLGVSQRVAGGNRLGVEHGDRQTEGDSVEPGPLAAGKILGMPPLVDGDRRNVAVEMDRGGPGVVVIAAEQPAREDGLGRHREGPDRVAERPADGPVLPQPSPILERGILVDPHLDVFEIIVSEVFGDRSFGGGRDAVILDATIPEDDLRGDAEHPSGAIEHLSRFAPLDRGELRQRYQIRRRDRSVDDDLARREAAVAHPARGERESKADKKRSGAADRGGVAAHDGAPLAGRRAGTDCPSIAMAARSRQGESRRRVRGEPRSLPLPPHRIGWPPATDVSRWSSGTRRRCLGRA